MGEIFSPPEEIKKPDITIGDIDEYFKKENEYVQEIVELAKKQGEGKHAGDIIKFQVADGYAQYVVLSLNPVQLIHLPIGDEYQFPYVHRLTADDIKEKAEQHKRLKELFSRKKEED